MGLDTLARIPGVGANSLLGKPVHACLTLRKTEMPGFLWQMAEEGIKVGER